MIFSTFTVLCSDHPLPSSRIFSSPKSPPCPPGGHFSVFPPPALDNLLRIYFLSLWLCLFWTCHTHGIVPHMTFVSGFFHTAPCFQASPTLWHVSELDSFLWPHRIPIVWIYHRLSVQQLMDTELFPLFRFYEECYCEHWCTNFCVDIFSNLLGIHT